MILTGKALEEFLQWNEDNNAPLSTYAIEQGLIYGTVLNSIIIEWLDSVGIYVFIERAMYLEVPNFIYRIETKDDLHEGYRESNRQEATEQAIIKANEIYNDRTK